jgi:hypothetical protein
MGNPTANTGFVGQHRGDGDSPDDPNVFTLAEMQAAMGTDSVAVSLITSQVASRSASGALDSIPVSTADSKAISSGGRASVADSKAISGSVVTSVVDSKTASNSLNISIADSKGVSAAFFASAPSAIVSTADSKAVSAGTAFQTDKARLAQVNVKDYGALGDGSNDDYSAFESAHAALPTTGGTILVPVTTTNTYYLGQAWNITKPVRILGSLPSASVSDSTRGTILQFAAEQNGIVFNGDTTLGDTEIASRGYAANYSIIDGLSIVSAGGTTNVDGIRIRCPGVLVRNCWVTGFKRNGIRIVASVGGAGATIGNANLWRVEHCYLLSNGSDGLFTDGSDSNAGIAISVDATNNGGWGIYDSSFLGNTYIACHTSGNTTGPYKTDDANAHNVFLGCYQEGAANLSSLVTPTIVLGGNLGTEGSATLASTAFIMSGGISHRGQFQHQNLRGTVDIGSGLGLADTTMTALTFGSADDGANLDGWKLVYDNVNFEWNLINRASGTRRALTFPDGSLSPRAFAPTMKNGVYLNATYSFGGHLKAGAAAPSSSTWVKADRVLNDWTVSGTAAGIEYWYCQTAGAPGTWVANRAMGTFTCAAAAATVVSNINVIGSNTRIVITPTNAAAGTLQAGANALYVSAKTANTSFTVTTAAGGSAGGTETFDYVIFN